MWQLPPGLKPEEILLYSRKSRTDDPLMSVEEVLANHEQMMDDWVERNLPGLGKIPEENRFREVVSGETLASRPRVMDLLRRAESQKYKAVLIKEPQRLSRGDLEDIGRLVKLLRYSNTLVFTLDYMYDLRDTRDRDDFERELKRGNDFLEYQKKIQSNGRLLAVSNGWYIGTWAPYGYKKITVMEGKKTRYTLEPIPEQAAVVRQIYEWYRDGWGSHKIARELTRMGVPTSKGCSKWSPESLKRMRTNEHYLGKTVWNRRKEVRTVEDGEVIVSRPLQEEYLVFPGKHPAIVDQELFDIVQEIRGKLPPVKGKAKCSNPFAGLVFCQCGRTMSRRTYKRKDGSERNPPRLLCDDQVNCGTASCYVSEMEALVVQELKNAIADFDIKIKKGPDDAVELHRQIVAQHEKRLSELAALELAQWEDKYAGKMPEHIFEKLNAKLLAERDQIQQALCDLKDTLPEPVDYEVKKQTFHAALDALDDPDIPVLKKNLLLKECIERIDYSREKKKSGSRRWGDSEPIELDITLRV